MFGKSIKLFTVFGFTVNLDMSWFIIGLLITWSLASGVFPQMYPDLSSGTYWLMGIGGALGLFASIVFHELSHSLVARQFGLPMRGITLFIFGGVAEMSDEPPSPKAEFFMAAAGPLASIMLGLLLLGVGLALRHGQVNIAIAGAVSYLGFINLILAAFNLIPGFPLDGGRILRSALWYWRGNLRWASRIAANIGAAFGMVLIILGVISVLGGQVIGGVWYFLIGMFLRGAAQSSYQQVLLRQALGGETVANFMTENPITVTPDMTLETLVDDYIYRYHHKLFPITNDGCLTGCITMQQVKQVPRDQWHAIKVENLQQACVPNNTISPQADAMQALARMNRTRTSRLLVVDNSRLEGIITLKDLLEFFALKVELEDQDADLVNNTNHREIAKHRQQ